METPTAPPPLAAGPPICWPHAPGALTLRRAGRGTVDVLSPSGRIVAAAVSEPVARVVADYARCREIADRVAATESAPCPAAELDADDRAVLAWLSGNPIWSHPGVGS